MNKETIGINTQNNEYLYDVEYWRKAWCNSVTMLDTNKTIRKQLAEVDTYYNSAKGLIELGSVIRGKAGVAKTRKAVETLKKAIEKNEYR